MCCLVTAIQLVDGVLAKMTYSNPIQVDTDIRLRGYVVSSDLEDPISVFGRSRPLYRIEIEPADPFFVEELMMSVYTDIGHMCSEEELNDIRKSLTGTLVFDTINSPFCSCEVHPGKEVDVTVQFVVSTTQDGEHSYLNKQLSFVDEVPGPTTEDEEEWSDDDNYYSF